jgi:hypothetical protein
MGSEAPAVYHFFVAATVLGASFGRTVYVNKGYYKLYPSPKLLLVGPTGAVRKSSAINLGVKVLQKLNVATTSKKTTPEGLIEDLDSEILKDGKLMARRDSVGVIIAPEFAVLLGKQKYNEGMIGILTDLFDDPDEWSYKTRGKGLIKLQNVAVSCLAASTPDWLVSAISPDAFGGGFMSRLLFIVQYTTTRCFPIPEAPPDYDALVESLQELRDQTGEIRFSNDGYEWYVTWYAASRGDVPEDPKMAGYHERKPDHLLRLGMILALSERQMLLTREHLTRASRILRFLEDSMLYTFKWLGMKPAGQDSERIIRTLVSLGGKASHATLLKKLFFFMNINQFTVSMNSLVESELVIETITPQGHTYSLAPTTSSSA